MAFFKQRHLHHRRATAVDVERHSRWLRRGGGAAGKGRNGDVDGTSDSPAALAQAAANVNRSQKAIRYDKEGTTD